MRGLGSLVIVIVVVGAACTSTEVEPALEGVGEPTTATSIGAAPGQGSSQGGRQAAEAEPRAVDRVIDDLDNVGRTVVALGSVWAATSNLPDEFSPGEIQAGVVRIDPSTGRVEHVLSSPGVEPTFAEAGGLLWVKLIDRLAALDGDGTEVESIRLDLGRSDGVTSAAGLLWVVLNDQDQIAVIDPVTASILARIETGDFPVSPVSAFGLVWIPNLIDGTITVIDAAAGLEGEVITRFVTDGPKFVIPVPGGATGDEMWVTNTAGEVFALSAERDDLGQVRPIHLDRSINSVVVHGQRAFLLPTWGTSVVVLDLLTEAVLAEIPIDSIPVRGLSEHDLVWVTGDGVRETLTAIDPDTLTIRDQFTVGSNGSNTTGPRQPLVVGDEIWVPNRGDDALFIVEVGGQGSSGR